MIWRMMRDHYHVTPRIKLIPFFLPWKSLLYCTTVHLHFSLKWEDHVGPAQGPLPTYYSYKLALAYQNGSGFTTTSPWLLHAAVVAVLLHWYCVYGNEMENKGSLFDL